MTGNRIPSKDMIALWTIPKVSDFQPSATSMVTRSPGRTESPSASHTSFWITLICEPEPKMQSKTWLECSHCGRTTRSANASLDMGKPSSPSTCPDSWNDARSSASRVAKVEEVLEPLDGTRFLQSCSLTALCRSGDAAKTSPIVTVIGAFSNWSAIFEVSKQAPIEDWYW